MTIIIVHFSQTLFLNVKSFPRKVDISVATTNIIFLACLEKLILPNWDAIREGGKHTKLHFYLLLIHYCCEWALVFYWRWIVNFPCWKSSLKVIHLTWGQSFGNHGILYIISNLPKVSIWRLKDFRICPSIAEKSTMLLFSGTFGHTVDHFWAHIWTHWPW